MAGAPQRKYQEDIEPDIRPNLTSIQGGGESTPERANLKAISNSENNPSATGEGGSVSNQEANPGGANNVIQGPWANNTTAQAVTAKIPGKFKGGKKAFGIGGIVLGVLGIPILLLVLLFPLKMEMFIKNITSIATSVPGYAVEQRLEYLVTRALAVRLLMSVNGNIPEDEGKLVFCRNGSVACSLFSTYTTDYFERKLGITMEVDANGRTRLGGTARSWDISLGKEDGIDIQGPMQRIQSNSEMRAFIKKEVYEKGKNYSVLTRYITRKLLMKKFGVVFWRGPPKLEQTANRLADARANIKSSVMKATIGKISPRLAIYLTCLQDSATCSNLRSKLSAALDPVSEPDPDSDNYEAEKRAYDKYEASKAILDGTTLTDADAKGPLKGLISKKVLSVVGGGAAVIGVVDLIMSAVDSIDDGALEKIWYDMSTQTYVGFSTEMQVINDKLKLGELDTDTVAASFALFEDAETSALTQVESGLQLDTSEGITATCKGPAEDKIPTKLEPGQVVCSDQRVVRDYVSGLASDPGWSTLATVAEGWEASIGAVIQFAGDGIGAVLEPLLGGLMDLANGLIEPIVNWFVGLIFEPPAVGYEASGADNYTALSAGIRVENNALFEEGVDEDGTAMGGGGSLLTNEEVAVITQRQQQAELDEFNGQSFIARLFDTSSRFSFINQFALRMPSSLGGFARLPFNSLSSVLSGSSAHAATASAVNPFNMPLYGYAANDPALTADPGVYTEEYCAGTAAAREATFGAEEGSGRIETYKISDPCALEKMVVGTALTAEGIHDDPYSLKYPASQDAIISSDIVLPVDKTYTSPLTSDGDFGPRNCNGCTSWHRGIDFSMAFGSPVYAVGAGEIVASGIGKTGGAGVECAILTGYLNNNTVTIKLGNGVLVDYLHMGGADITVNVGDKVTAGQQIGKVNTCGESNGHHLHLAVRPGETTDEAVKALPKNPEGDHVNPVEWFKLYGVDV